MHSYLGMVWCAVYFGHQPCGISRTNCQGQSWNKLCNVCRTNCQNKLLMFAGTIYIYLLAVTLCSSFANFGRWARLAAFQPSRGPLAHSLKWFHWKVSVVCGMGVTPVPGLINLLRPRFVIVTLHHVYHLVCMPNVTNRGGHSDHHGANL